MRIRRRAHAGSLEERLHLLRLGGVGHHPRFLLVLDVDVHAAAQPRGLDEVVGLRDDHPDRDVEQRGDDAVVHHDRHAGTHAERVHVRLDRGKVVRLDGDEHEIHDAIAEGLVVADESHAGFAAHGVHEGLHGGYASGPIAAF